MRFLSETHTNHTIVHAVRAPKTGRFKGIFPPQKILTSEISRAITSLLLHEDGHVRDMESHLEQYRIEQPIGYGTALAYWEDCHDYTELGANPVERAKKFRDKLYFKLNLFLSNFAQYHNELSGQRGGSQDERAKWELTETRITNNIALANLYPYIHAVVGAAKDLDRILKRGMYDEGFGLSREFYFPDGCSERSTALNDYLNANRR